MDPPQKKMKEEKNVPKPRAPKKAVPEEAKDEKYWDMRRKNSEATKRWREAKRQELANTMSSASNLDKELADAEAELAEWVKKYKSLKKSNQELEQTLAKINPGN